LNTLTKERNYDFLTPIVNLIEIERHEHSCHAAWIPYGSESWKKILFRDKPYLSKGNCIKINVWGRK